MQVSVYRQIKSSKGKGARTNDLCCSLFNLNELSCLLFELYAVDLVREGVLLSYIQ